ncbi:dihydroorotase, homodimeric type [Paraphysoderma sedebokerense]|nr:dihydroorotase, homodimeric type [Paraphysoderma sedebokerense]
MSSPKRQASPSRPSSPKKNAPGQTLTLPMVADLHIHLRQGTMMEMLAPKIKGAGVDTVYVMPNLKPPVTTTEKALEYKKKLESLAPGVKFMMTLYLTPELTPEEVKKAKKAGISGVKSYPRGVTTNSDSGIESYTTYYPVFKAMEEVGMVLNLHGEVPSDASKNISVLNAEAHFLQHLKQLHKDFPRLKIVLEHASTKAAVDMVKSLGDTVGCTITLHHLVLIVDDWAGQPHHFCKPVAKTPEDREALIQVIQEGHPRFFLGTDSAPHPRNSKETSQCAAGVFTSFYTVQYLVQIFESQGMLDKVENFACHFGRKFYGIEKEGEVVVDGKRKKAAQEYVVLKKADFPVPKEIAFGKNEGTVVPFMAGKTLAWSIEKFVTQ